MHILLRERHGLEETAGAEDLGQTPADLAVLSFADSDLGAFAAAWRGGRDTLPSLRLANLRRLAHPLSVDLYLQKTLSGARGILIRLLGGIDYWRYGVEQVSALAAKKGIALAIIPGDGRADPRLDAASNLPPSTLRRLKTLCDNGGSDSARAALAQLALAAGLAAPPPVARAALPRYGFYAPGAGVVEPGDVSPDSAPIVPVVFYRAILAASDTDPIDRLLAELARRGLCPIGLFATSLKDPESDGWLREQLVRIAPDVIVNATAFSAQGDGGKGSPFDVVDAPVLQVAVSGASRQAWAESDRGLSPSDLAIHVVLPELDGRIFAGVASFKQVETADPELGYGRTVHAGDDNRIASIVARAQALIALRRTATMEKRLAIVLSAYPGRDDQMAHAVGLDAPESAVETLKMLREQGYATGDIPADGAALIDRLKTETIRWHLHDYRVALARLDPALVADLEAQWGEPESDPAIEGGDFVFKAVRCGQTLIAVQPDRGRHADRAVDYHDVRRAPRHAYVAFYLWLKTAKQPHALIHMGAHGTLEWLPGKSVALSAACWPDALIGPTPVIYPFIVNNPGEAASAKRRLGAVTIGHITPPISTGALPPGLHAIERLLDEYSVADGLDPRRRERLAGTIVDSARQSGLDRDSGLTETMTPLESVVRLDSFVCDVKNTLVADGLHIFGRAPLHTEDDTKIPFDDCAASERAAMLTALAGRHVAPGPAGSPWRGRRDVLPTGRNLFTVDTRAVPSRNAADQGKRLAEALLRRHLQDHGDYPRQVMLDLWGSATMRTAGEEFAMALHLMGIAPVWDTTSDRVTGFDVVTLAMLGRPRIDVALRISGLFRDVFSNLPILFEQAAAALAARDEPAGENPYRNSTEPRVFGPAPGDYGIGVVEAVTEFTPATVEDAGEAWLAGSAFAYGGGHDGAAARTAIEQRTAATDAFVHPQDLPETDLLSAPDYPAHQGGFAAAARKLTGSAPTLYHADSTNPEALRVRTLNEEVARAVRGRAANPRWLAGQMRHGFRGAAEIAATLDQMAQFAHLAGAVESHHFDLYYDATLGDDDVRRFIEQANPEAARVMRQRFQQMLEAGYWITRRNSVIERIAAAPAEAKAAS